MPAIESAQKAFDDQLKADKTDQFNLTEEGKRKRGLVADAKRTYDEKINAANAKAVNITVSKGRLIILATTLVLMGILTYLVMFTKRGRAMRAVSHDFQTASLMEDQGQLDHHLHVHFRIGACGRSRNDESHLYRWNKNRHVLWNAGWNEGVRRRRFGRYWNIPGGTEGS